MSKVSEMMEKKINKMFEDREEMPEAEIPKCEDCGAELTFSRGHVGQTVLFCDSCNRVVDENPQEAINLVK